MKMKKEPKYNINDVVYTIHNNQIIKCHIGGINYEIHMNNEYTHEGIYEHYTYTLYSYFLTGKPDKIRGISEKELFTSVDELIDFMKIHISDRTHTYYEDDRFH